MKTTRRTDESIFHRQQKEKIFPRFPSWFSSFSPTESSFSTKNKLSWLRRTKLDFDAECRSLKISHKSFLWFPRFNVFWEKNEFEFLSSFRCCQFENRDSKRSKIWKSFFFSFLNDLLCWENSEKDSSRNSPLKSRNLAITHFQSSSKTWNFQNKNPTTWSMKSWLKLVFHFGKWIFFQIKSIYRQTYQNKTQN